MRIQGSAGVAPIECVNPRKDKWRVRWNIEEQDGMATYEEAEFDRRPTLEEIKTTVLASYNARIDEAIRSGFRWEETPVWLSAENQFNYKAAFDLAVQTDGANLPVVFKLGTDEKPVYREFTTIDELKNFYTAAMAHVQGTLAAGWKAKDEIDFGLYRVWRMKPLGGGHKESPGLLAVISPTYQQMHDYSRRPGDKPPCHE